MLQGLINATAIFQCKIDKVIAGVNLIEINAFLDDLNIFSVTIEEHKEHFMKVLNRLADNDLKVSLLKCILFQCSVMYLQDTISEGIRSDRDKSSGVEEWPRPNTICESCSFIRFAGY